MDNSADSKYTVLLIEDNPDWIKFFNHVVLVSKLNIFNQIYYADTIETAKNIINHHKIDLVLLDIMLPDSQTTDTIEWGSNIPLPVIILTSLVDKTLQKISLANGIEDYLVKDEYDDVIFFYVAKTAILRFISKMDTSKSEFMQQLKNLCRKLENIESTLEIGISELE
jgi:response regulator of citrate/malate metabolism